LAEPLRPWSGPLAAALATGEAFQAKAVSAITDAVGAEVSSLAGDLDETERRRSTAFIDLALGRRRTYVNECAGLYYPFLPADEFFDGRHFPWFAELASATDAIRDELEALLGDPGEALRPYVRMDAGTPDSHWTPLDQSLDWGACFLWEYGEPNRQVIERCPRTAEVIASIPGATIPGRAPNAFFSLLRPRTRIPPHTGVTNTRAIVHLPLIVPEGCGFRVGGETRSWVEGQPLAFDDTIEHEAWNDSDSLRAVLILDCWNPHLTEAERQIITRYFDAADSAGYNPRREE
jgi:aspartyl/asparaginyl beta-hydroxylase (cupin superfamily)